MQTPVDIQVSEGIVQITLNRPERRNALSFEMAHTVSETLDELDARSDLQVAIITGAGGCFQLGDGHQGLRREWSATLAAGAWRARSG